MSLALAHPTVGWVSANTTGCKSVQGECQWTETDLTSWEDWIKPTGTPLVSPNIFTTSCTGTLFIRSITRFNVFKMFFASRKHVPNLER